MQLIVLLAVVFVVKFAWLLAAFAAVAVLGRMVGQLLRRRDNRAAMLRRRDAELCARADRQNAWVLAGDERGVYGLYPPTELLPGVL
jgi:hypothetical protein